MDNINDMLASMGISLTSVMSSEPVRADAVEPRDTTVDTYTIQQEPEHTTESGILSDDDFNDILSENGFTDTEGNTSQSESIRQAYNEMMESISESLRQAHDERMESIESGTEQISENLPDWENNGQPPEIIVPEEEEENNAEYDETEDLDEVGEDSVSVVGEVNNEPEKIPLNSPTLLMDETTSRFSGAEWYNEIQKQRIILAGLGGIGSWLAVQLARMSPEALYLYDDDTVEAGNMSGQMYSNRAIGDTKVMAISNIIMNYTNTNNLYAINERFTRNTPAGDVICGFDNMEARKTFFQSWLNHVMNQSADKSKCLFIDGRLSMDTLQVFCIQGTDIYNIERYQREFLFSDSEADETVCSMKQTTYLACMIGSIMTNLFTNWVANQLEPIIPYDLPFFTEYDSQNVIFKTER